MNMSSSDKQKILDSSETTYSRITIYKNGQELAVCTEDDYLQEWKYEDYRYVPEHGFIGQFVERLLDGKFINLPESLNINDCELKVELGVKGPNDATPTYYSLGNFLLTKVSDTDTTGTVSFEACDYAKKFNAVYEDRIQYPCFAAELVDDICDQAGVNPAGSTYSDMVYAYPQISDDELPAGNYSLYDTTSGKYYNFTSTRPIQPHECIYRYHSAYPNYVFHKYIGSDGMASDGTYSATQSTTATGTVLNARRMYTNELRENWNFIINNNQFESDATLRDVAKALAQLAYSCAFIDCDNRLRFKFNKKTTSNVTTYTTIDEDHYYKATKTGDTYGPVDRVLIGMSNVTGENVVNDNVSKTTGTDITLNDTRARQLEVDLGGNCVQNGTPTPSSPVDVEVVTGNNTVNLIGKNLIENTLTSTSSGGITVTVNADKSITFTTASTGSTGGATLVLKDHIPNLKNGVTYTLSANCNLPNYVYFRLQDQSNTSYFYGLGSSSGDTSKSITFTYDNRFTSGECRLIVWFASSSIGQVFNFTLYPMLEVNSSATEYTPYVNQNYPLNLGVTNYFNINATPDTTTNNTVTKLDNGLKLTVRASTTWNYVRYLIMNIEQYAGKKITLSSNITYTGSTAPRLYLGTCDSSCNNRVELYNVTPSSNGFYKCTATLPTTFTNTNNYLFVNLYTATSSGAGIDDYVIYDDIQLEIGDKANSYTPYGQTPIELYKIGNYKDTIYNYGDKWYLHKEIGKCKFIGGSDENWVQYDSTSDVKKYQYYLYLPNSYIPASSSEIAKGICSHFQATAANDFWGNAHSAGDALNKFAITPISNPQLFVDVYSISIDTLNGFKSWLANNNIIIYYPVSTPTDTEITEPTLIEQLNTLRDKATGYMSQTNVTQSNSFAPFTLSVGELGEMIAIYDNPLTYTEELRKIALSGSNSLMGLTYTPVSVETTGYPWLYADDYVKVEDIDGATYYTYPFNRTIKYSGYMVSSIDSEAKSIAQTNYAYEGDIDSRLKHTEIIVDKHEGQILLINESVDKVEGDVTGLEGKYSDVLSQVDTANTNITQLSSSVRTIQDSTYSKTEVKQIAEGVGPDGVKVTVVSSAAGTFDINGMHYEKSGAPTKSTINEAGLKVNATDSDSTELLYAGYNSDSTSDTYGQSIVRTANLTVTNWAVFGTHGRFEEYTDENDREGVGFFLV